MGEFAVHQQKPSVLDSGPRGRIGINIKSEYQKGRVRNKEKNKVVLIKRVGELIKRSIVLIKRVGYQMEGKRVSNGR